MHARCRVCDKDCSGTVTVQTRRTAAADMPELEGGDAMMGLVPAIVGFWEFGGDREAIYS